MKRRFLLVYSFCLIISCLTAQDNFATISGYIYDLEDNYVSETICPSGIDDFEVIFTTVHGETYNGNVHSDGSGGSVVYTLEIELLLEDPTNIPNEISISQNFPNPFKPFTNFSATVLTTAKFDIYNINGRKINSINFGNQGTYKIIWGGENRYGLASPPGLYLYQFFDEITIKSGKMVLIGGETSGGLSYLYIDSNYQIRKPNNSIKPRIANGTIKFSAPCITDVYLQLSVTQDTTINLKSNVAPIGNNSYYEINIGDTLNIDLNDIVQNDSPTLFEVSDNFKFQLYDENILQYIPLQLDTQTVEVIAIDSLDTDLFDTISITTLTIMEPPSVEYYFEIDTMGYQLFNVMRDVAIGKNDDYIAVGHFALPIPNEYSHITFFDAMVRENGIISPSILVYDIALQLEAIQYFNENDIWVVSGYAHHYDGVKWTLYSYPDVGLPDTTHASRALWGPTPDNMYFVGYFGTIVHYQDGEWEQLGAGITNIHLKSVHGSPDGSHIFVTGWNNVNNPPIDNYGTIALEIVDDEVNVLYEITEVGQIGDYGFAIPEVYVFGDTAYFACDEYLWKYNYLTQESSVIVEDESYLSYFFPSGIQVNAVNDIILGGSAGEFVSFNGKWHTNFEVYDRLSYNGNVKFGGLDYKNGHLFFAGSIWSGRKALVARGYRNR